MNKTTYRIVTLKRNPTTQRLMEINQQHFIIYATKDLGKWVPACLMTEASKLTMYYDKREWDHRRLDEEEYLTLRFLSSL